MAGRTFKGQSVVIDGKTFKDTTFDSCVLIFRGGGAVHIERCRFLHCEYVFDGAAANTLAMMAALYRGGARELIENTFAEIRAGRNLSITKH